MVLKYSTDGKRLIQSINHYHTESSSSSNVSFPVIQRKDFPSNSFYVVVVVKTEDEACGGPLRFYPLRPDELIDAGNRSKTVDVVVTPAINCKSHMHQCHLIKVRHLRATTNEYFK